jgi:hypothetical protein
MSHSADAADGLDRQVQQQDHCATMSSNREPVDDSWVEKEMKKARHHRRARFRGRRRIRLRQRRRVRLNQRRK